jgi:hypothetical protein
MWAILGLEPTTDTAVIRRAYATVLRRTNPDEDPAGFARLRQAYEVALMQARAAAAASSVAADARVGAAPMSAPSHGASTPVVAEAVPVSAPAQGEPTPVVAEAAPVPAPAQGEPPPGAAAPIAAAPIASAGEDSPAAVSPTDRDQLHTSFAALQIALAAPESAGLDVVHSLLERCLQSPALENLSVQIEFEAAIVRLLLQYQPRSVPLLETVIDRWRWRERGRMVGGGIAALVAHADDLRHLRQLESSQPRIHSALTRKPDGPRLWLQIVLFRLDTSVREEMAQWRTNVSSGANPDALAWWRQYFERPHLQPNLIRATGIFTVIGVLIGLLAGSADGAGGSHAFTAGVLGLLFGVCLTGLWWGLIEWPRYRLTQTRRTGPRWLRIGWAPAAFAVCILASLCPDTGAMTAGAVVVSSAILLWTMLMAPGVSTRSRDYLVFRVWVPLIGNVAIVIWWGLLATTPDVAPTMPMWVAFAGALLALAAGQPLLWHEYQSSLSMLKRQLVRMCIAAIALAALGLLICVNINAAEGSFLLAVLSVIVLLHRVAATNLTGAQIKFRHYITVLPAAILARELHDDLESALRMGGMLFMIGVVLSMATCFYNAWLANRQGEPSEA